MNKIAFIVPYFGKFRSDFSVWLHSCKYNSHIDWLIFTDDHTPYDYPSNVKVYYSTFEKTKKQFQNYYDFNISMDYPYRLCEYRVAYGEVYCNYLTQYDFWGYCDTDIVWGNLKKHLPNEVLEANSKISCRGHLTLMKNNERINKLYRSKVQGRDYYKEIFTNDTGYPTAFDERAINHIFLDAGEKMYTDLVFADLAITTSNFHIHHLPESDAWSNKHQIFLWNKGELLRLYTDENDFIYQQSFAYVHLIRRQMKLSIKHLEEKFLIIPNRFMEVPREITADLIKKYTTKRFYWEYYWERLNIRFLKNKIQFRNSKMLFEKRFNMPSMLYKTNVIPSETKKFEGLNSQVVE